MHCVEDGVDAGDKAITLLWPVLPTEGLPHDPLYRFPAMSVSRSTRRENRALGGSDRRATRTARAGGERQVR